MDLGRKNRGPGVQPAIGAVPAGRFQTCHRPRGGSRTDPDLRIQLFAPVIPAVIKEYRPAVERI